MPCPTILNLRHPVRSEKRRGFQPPWYTVYVYKCPTCGHEHHVRAGSFRGKRPEPGIGGIYCNGP